MQNCTSLKLWTYFAFNSKFFKQLGQVISLVQRGTEQQPPGYQVLRVQLANFSPKICLPCKHLNHFAMNLFPKQKK